MLRPSRNVIWLALPRVAPARTLRKTCGGGRQRLPSSNGDRDVEGDVAGRDPPSGGRRDAPGGGPEHLEVGSPGASRAGGADALPRTGGAGPPLGVAGRGSLAGRCPPQPRSAVDDARPDRDRARPPLHPAARLAPPPPRRGLGPGPLPAPRDGR